MSRSDFTVSIHYDRRLYKHDVRASIAHARMLARQGIIEAEEAEAIADGLVQVYNEIESGDFHWKPELEDVHMNIESRLFEVIGDVAGKLHTARSRNDQVSVDIRMYTKDAITDARKAIRGLRLALVEVAEANQHVVMPGYTHVQRAQPVLFAHHMLAYFEMLGRDAERFDQAYQRADVLPLGTGALAGVTYSVDREWLAEELGFSAVSSNSMDAASDRDFLLDFESAAAVCMVHLSRLAEELVLWSSDEFGFIRMADEYTTGSSMMPQKRNPDFAELSRGKSGRVFGNLVGLLTLLKGLPLTYNRDMQEDKEGFFDTVDTLQSTLDVMAGMVSTMTLNVDRMSEAADSSYLLATDVADYLVKRGVPFREAHGIVAKLSTSALQDGRKLSDLSIDEYRSFSDAFDEDVTSISVESSLAARDVVGGTAPNRVRQAVAEAKATLEAQE